MMPRRTGVQILWLTATMQLAAYSGQMCCHGYQGRKDIRGSVVLSRYIIRDTKVRDTRGRVWDSIIKVKRKRGHLNIKVKIGIPKVKGYP